MGRNRVFPIGALNIAIHEPHSAQRYVQLFNEIYAKRRIVILRGSNGALVGSLNAIQRERPQDGLQGEIYQFTHIDSRDSWFNVNSLEEASSDEVSIINIPEHLKPHLARFSFVFFPADHRLYIQTRNRSRTISVYSVKNCLRQ